MRRDELPYDCMIDGANKIATLESIEERNSIGEMREDRASKELFDLKHFQDEVKAEIYMAYDTNEVELEDAMEWLLMEAARMRKELHDLEARLKR